MKRYYYIGVLLLLTLAACHTPTREARRMLARAERLADTLPDSTLRLIDSVMRMEAYLSERERMDMALLQGEVLFRDASLDDDFSEMLERTATSPELEHAADYYAKKKHFDKAAHAALYSGYVQQYYNDKEAAMQSFKDVEHYAGLVGDSLCMARAEYKIGKMLYDDGAEEEALALFKVLENNYNDNRCCDKAIINNMMASCYILFKDYEHAELCLKASLEYVQKGHCLSVRAKILNNYAVLYRQQGEFDKAIDFLRQKKYELGRTIDDENLFMLTLNMGKIYMIANEIDSANYYFQQLEEMLPSIDIKGETKISAYGSLSHFAEAKNNDSLALLYQKKLGNLLYLVMLQRQEQNTYRIQKQYDYEALQNAMNKKLARTQRIIAIGIVLLLSIVALFLFRSSQRNKREAEANANLFHFMQQNKALIESNMSQEKRILDTTQQLSDMMYGKFKSLLLLNYCLKTPKDKGALKDLGKEVFETDDPWETIKEILSTLYPGLEETLRLKYPEMDELELRVCLLSRFRLSRRIEAALLGVSMSVLDKLRMKVRKMMEE